LTRLRTLLLFAALAGLTAVFAACGGGSSSSDENPKTVLEGATFEGVENADLDLSVGVEVSGAEGGKVDVKLSGPFQSGGKEQLPELAMSAEAHGSVKGENVDFEGGLTLVPHKAYVEYEGSDYEVDSTTFSFVESAIEQAQRESGAKSGAAGATACQEEAKGKFSAGDFLENLKNEGSADVGGTSTTKVSGELNVGGAVDIFTKLLELPACKSQLEAAGPLQLAQLAKAKGEIEKALKSAHGEIYVGEDHIIRRVTAQFEIAPEGSGEEVKIDLDLSLNGVNEGQEISTPENAKPLTDLYEKLGINPLELLEQAQGPNGLGGLLESLGGATGSPLGGALPGAGSGSGSGGGSSQQEYLECIQGASSSADIQNCSKKLQ
jgi:hypothetical protein